MKLVGAFGFFCFFLSGCASLRSRQDPPPPRASTDAPSFDQRMDARVESKSDADEPLAEARSLEAIPPLSREAPRPTRPPVVGVWVEGAGLESLVALGFMQELERAGVKFAKVVGTGWGCWVALSWALEASANQAEWQAFKWSSWAPLGMERGFLSRFTGERANYDDFARELRIWLPKSEFAELALPADCPVLRNSSPIDLVSSRGLGLQRALWESVQVPLFKRKPGDDSKASYLSGLAAGAPRLDEYDRFSDIASSTPVEFWIHLKASPASLMAMGDPWLSATFARRELKGEAWAKTKQGRWVMRMPLFVGQNFDERKGLDFGGRRAMILKGRDLARHWMQSSWFRNNLSGAFNQ
jgi:hypothetical protein